MFLKTGTRLGGDSRSKGNTFNSNTCFLCCCYLSWQCFKSIKIYSTLVYLVNNKCVHYCFLMYSCPCWKRAIGIINLGSASKFIWNSPFCLPFSLLSPLGIVPFSWKERKCRKIIPRATRYTKYKPNKSMLFPKVWFNSFPPEMRYCIWKVNLSTEKQRSGNSLTHQWERCFGYQLFYYICFSCSLMVGACNKRYIYFIHYTLLTLCFINLH